MIFFVFVWIGDGIWKGLGKGAGDMGIGKFLRSGGGTTIGYQALERCTDTYGSYGRFFGLLLV